eukprot:TRINITY_DN14689_c0_g1_i1.p1 TRINITY_DN14689_c0_g1~~TRINITY_DN14689_c0_g1_i1.p1  ORF type:complete len:191 (-),score=35.18 TRINITY_DN14689_c0_g1_i1:411-983(-)
MTLHTTSHCPRQSLLSQRNSMMFTEMDQDGQIVGLWNQDSGTVLSPCRTLHSPRSFVSEDGGTPPLAIPVLDCTGESLSPRSTRGLCASARSNTMLHSSTIERGSPILGKSNLKSTLRQEPFRQRHMQSVKSPLSQGLATIQAQPGHLHEQQQQIQVEEDVGDEESEEGEEEESPEELEEVNEISQISHN